MRKSEKIPALSLDVTTDRPKTPRHPQTGLAIALSFGAALTLFLGSCSSSPTQTTANSASPAMKESPAKTEASPAKTQGAATGSKVNINTASNAELDKLELPGTKPSLSERIETARPYATTDDLVKKKAISPEEYALIKNLVTTEK